MIADKRDLIDFINARPQPEPETGLNYGGEKHDTNPPYSVLVSRVGYLEGRVAALEAMLRRETDNAHG